MARRANFELVQIKVSFSDMYEVKSEMSETSLLTPKLTGRFLFPIWQLQGTDRTDYPPKFQFRNSREVRMQATQKFEKSGPRPTFLKQCKSYDT